MGFALVYMKTAKNQVTANFESKEFYTNTRYQQIKSINKLHPLQMVVDVHGQATSNPLPAVLAIGALIACGILTSHEL